MRSTLAGFVGIVAFAVLATLASAPRAQGTSPDLFAPSRSARDGGRFGMLLRQFRAEEPALPDRHEAWHREATAAYQAARDIPAGNWVWQRPYWFVFRDVGGPPHRRSWGAEAAWVVSISAVFRHD